MKRFKAGDLVYFRYVATDWAPWYPARILKLGNTFDYRIRRDPTELMGLVVPGGDSWADDHQLQPRNAA